MTATDFHDRISNALRKGDLRGGGLLLVPRPQGSARESRSLHQRPYLTTSLAPATFAIFQARKQQAVIGSEVLEVSDAWCC